MLVVGGLAIGLVPGLPDVELEPDVVFLIFLPPLLHAAGWYSSPQGAVGRGAAARRPRGRARARHDGRRRRRRPRDRARDELGGRVRAGRDRRPDRPGLRPGDVLPPRRPRADADARRGRVDDQRRDRARRLPRRARRDHRAARSRSARRMLDFVVSAAGGAAIGLAIGWLFTRLIRRQTNEALGILLSVLNAYAGYIVAEELHVSGVLGAVFAGIYSGWYAHTALDAGTRLSAHRLLAGDGPRARGDAVHPPRPPGAAARGRARRRAARLAGRSSSASRSSRCGWPSRSSRRPASATRGASGSRSAGRACAARSRSPPRSRSRSTSRSGPEILLLTFGVIFVTLLGQGLTLAPLLRKLDLRGDERWSPDEATARLETAQAALDRLEELEEEGASGEPVRRLRELYRGRFALCVAVLGGGELPEDGRRELKEYGAMRRELIARRARRADRPAQRPDDPRRPGAQDRARPRPRRGADPSGVGCGGDDGRTDAGRVGLRPRHDRRARRPRARHVVPGSAARDGAARRGVAPPRPERGPARARGRDGARRAPRRAHRRRADRDPLARRRAGGRARRLPAPAPALQPPDHAPPGEPGRHLRRAQQRRLVHARAGRPRRALGRAHALPRLRRPVHRHVRGQVPAHDRLRRPGRRPDRRRRPRPPRRAPRGGDDRDARGLRQLQRGHARHEHGRGPDLGGRGGRRRLRRGRRRLDHGHAQRRRHRDHLRRRALPAGRELRPRDLARRRLRGRGRALRHGRLARRRCRTARSSRPRS